MHRQQQNSQGIPSHRPRILRCSLVKNTVMWNVPVLTAFSAFLFSLDAKENILVLITLLKPKHHHYQDNDLFAWKKISCKHSATSKTYKPCACPLPGWVLQLFTTPMRMAGHPLHPTPGFDPRQSLCLAGGPLPPRGSGGCGEADMPLDHCSNPATVERGTAHFPPVPYEGKLPDFAVSHSLCFHQQIVTHLLYLPHLPFLFFSLNTISLYWSYDLIKLFSC